jgi:cyclic beta-1,2-glucan synthetase
MPEIEQPIRAELFSVERLEQHGESLAVAQKVVEGPGRPLIPRVRENGRVLLDCDRIISGAIREELSITPAAEWLVDNFHIVDEQLREIRDDLPVGFYRKLPKLASGPLAGYPQVYGVAWAFVAHTDSRFDPEVLRRFVAAYQRVQPLTIGELWAVAITLRIVLVENLRRLAEQIVRSRIARDEADALADSLLASDVPAPASLLARFERKPLSGEFAVELVQRLRDLDPKVAPVLRWLDARLAEQGTTADEIVRAEHQQQAAASVTVRNIITSMRMTSAFDWQEFFESASVVDQVLRQDSDFGAMLFATRDQYRHAIEDLSRGSDHSEIEVAEGAVQRAREARARPPADLPDSREADPGYYLISRGRLTFERELGFRLEWGRRLLRWYVRAATPGYLGTIAVITAMILSSPLLGSAALGVGAKGLVLLGILALVPASDLAIALINRLVTELLGPRRLPQMDFENGVPDRLRTMVAVPTMLTTARDIQTDVERLEVHYLANPDGALHFALLSDWTDAPTESTPADDELVAIAAAGIEELNQRYGPAPGGAARFILLHRRRQWNESEGKWIGWERKRGKLHELNQLLRGSVNTSFMRVGGHAPEAPAGIRYVLTLDSDTRLPLGGASSLIGAIAHPLNRARFSPREGRVVNGYGVVQPRITPSLPPDRQGSLFQKIFSGPSGIDPYASAVSDIYQDLFREGSYTGKGIYDIDPLEAALAEKVKENTLLSHDLLEGIFARTALASSIELFDEFPSHYETAAARQHRWARGDWQLLSWIFKWNEAGKGASSFTMPAISRWKMLDNLRRTLLAPATFLTLLVAWMLPHSLPWLWTRFILITIAVPPLLPFLVGLNHRLGGISKRTHFRSLLSDLGIGAAQIGLAVTFLAYQAWLMSDAIARTLARLSITRRNLLQWVTAAQSGRAVDLKVAGAYRRMAGGMGAAFGAALALWYRHSWQGRPAAWGIASGFMVLWAAAPVMARWISLPPHREGEERVSSLDAVALRLASRRTWRFFEKFITAEEHWLPPDNFQADPKPVMAHRTSPTNMGLCLLSIVAARDFGWLGIAETTERLNNTLSSVAQLELFRGHFLNWYNTRSLTPLEPRYVSSVDSGNLAGHLLTLGNACREMPNGSLGAPGFLAGVNDSLQLLRRAVAAMADTARTQTVTRKQLARAVEDLSALLDPPPRDAITWSLRLVALRAQVYTVADIAHTLAQERGISPDSELPVWADGARACVESHFRDAEILLPWMRLDAAQVTAMATRSPEKSPEWMAIAPFFRDMPSLADAPDRSESALTELAALRASTASGKTSDPGLLSRIDALSFAIQTSAAEAASILRRCSSITETAGKIFRAMDFGFLFDHSRKLFSIGYRVADSTPDPNCYDLLASEARLTSFVAIAKGDVPSSHWFRLARALTPIGRGSALVSWSGSMFEYLMPDLVMRSPAGSLLRQTYEQVVLRQIEYGGQRGVPWGISESAYNARDLDFTYQYSSFGVPGLGLRRGLSDDLVIAPYATALAAMIRPAAAVQNFARLEDAGGEGAYGFYDALDYTTERLPEHAKVAPVRTYMAHHQGMTLLALDNVLNDGVMQRRFHAEPIIQASELLLQERTPRDVLVARPREEEVSAAQIREMVPPVLRRLTTPHDVVPRTHLLSNGSYSVMLTAAGSGYSRWRDIAVTRWREDVTRDCWGMYFYLRDQQSGRMWSAGYQPAGVEPDSYEVAFSEDRAEIVRRDGALTTKLEVIVSSEDDAEVRRLSLTNLGARTRDIEVTSFAEICLAPQAADAAHPAFSNLFVQTEFAPEPGALLATRRKQSDKETTVWAAQVLVVEGETVGDPQYETDRARFIGRGHDSRDPVSVGDGRPLSNTAGFVLDPIMSLRRTVRVAPGATARLIFSTILASDREQALELADKYRNARTFERTLTLAWTQAQIQLHHLAISLDEALLFQRLANAVLYPDPSSRSAPVVADRPLDRSALWAQGISGDLPVVLARIDEPDDIEIIRQLLRAHEYWRMKQLSADLVIINERPASYAQELQGSLDALVRGSQLRLSPDTTSVRGNIFLLRGDLIPAQTRAVLQSVARVVLLSRRGTLSEQVMRSQRWEAAPARASRTLRPGKPQNVELPALPLEYFNGLGGFAEHGREYVTALGEGMRTPQPWVNVIANPSFGFLASESGSGFTWSLNSHENQLTPWSNDPVTDAAGEAIYIRDENTGEVWTPTALPIRDEASSYIARHGQGYTRFQHGSHGIFAELLQFVPPGDPVKISRLTLRNSSGRSRRLSVTAYAELVLGSSRTVPSPHVITEIDPATNALFARSKWAGDYAGRIVFADLAGRQTSWTGDRKEFLGRNGSPASPAALEPGAALSGKVGADLDACAALRTTIELRAGASAEIVFFLGEEESPEKARNLLVRYRAADLTKLFGEVASGWRETLGTVQVQTPDAGMNILLNHWLLYQTLACRVWARAGFYQASGAYGFRDQLQDAMALCVAQPSIAREHLLRAAGRQFVEGDVQHWWHPPAGRGVRTRISDDPLWLPFAVIHYIEATGDQAVLDEGVPFLEGSPLAEGQDDAYFLPQISSTRGTLFEHCARALDHSLAVGAHGLPLMGTGDWNDGMNRVGAGGKGESVWLAWFLHSVLWECSKLADTRGEGPRAKAWRAHAGALKAALEKAGWDGEWYRRAYYDDGTPLGSSENQECRIDSVAQSWAVISGAAEPARALRAMASVDQQLIRRSEGLSLLLTPPFNKTSQNPGYIKGYPPGIRENGGQYTHAAVWTTLAFAALGDGDKAAELFQMLNPISRTNSRVSVQRYKTEPYVVAGDVYSEPPHMGRGGWTWYTGSAGWLYRGGLEWILGFRLRGKTLTVDPCIPAKWRGYSLTFRYHSAVYEIKVENPQGVCRGVTRSEVDGIPTATPGIIPLDGARGIHAVRLVLGA